MLERFYDTIKLLISAFLHMVLGSGAPDVLLYRVQAPDYDVAAATPVVVPVGVEGAPALVIMGAA